MEDNPMKKLMFVILIVLALILCAGASADNPYVGIWVYEKPTSHSSRVIVTCEVDPTDKVFYCRQELFLDGSPADVQAGIYSCTYTKNTLTILDGDTVIRELYKVDAMHLSAYEKKTGGFFYRVPKTLEDYDTAIQWEPKVEVTPTPLPPDYVNMDPVGKWSFMHDFTNEYSDPLDFDYMAMDITLMPDGSAYLVFGSRAKKKSTLDHRYSDGLWLGDASGLRIKANDGVYNAWIDASTGCLKLKFTESNILTFTRINSTAIESN